MFFTEFLAFLKHRKKYWIAPIVLFAAGLSLLILLSEGAAIPFVYTLF